MFLLLWLLQPSPAHTHTHIPSPPPQHKANEFYRKVPGAIPCYRGARAHTQTHTHAVVYRLQGRTGVARVPVWIMHGGRYALRKDKWRARIHRAKRETRPRPVVVHPNAAKLVIRTASGLFWICDTLFLSELSSFWVHLFTFRASFGFYSHA